MTEREFEVFGRRIATLTSPGQADASGDGRRILALHGWLDNAASFIPLCRELPEHEWVALDMAGHGHSDHRSLDGEYNIWNDLPDIEAVADALGWESFTLVGHSRGAVVACLFASALPHRIDHLVLLDGLAAQSSDPAACSNQLAAYVKDRKRLPTENCMSEPGVARPDRVFATVDDAVAVRTRKGLSHGAAQLITERNLRAVDGGWCWRHDPRLLGASAFKLSDCHNAAIMAGLSMPGLLVLAEQGNRQWPGSLPPLPDTLSVETVTGGHHCHMEDSAAHIAGRIRSLLCDGVLQ
jgi:pimeloyl-ACP methyl ester carboxylesterase